MKEKPKVKKFIAVYRLRSYHCKRCAETINFFGDGDPATQKCPCCKRDLTKIPQISDSIHEVRKTVIPQGEFALREVSPEAASE